MNEPSLLTKIKDYFNGWFERKDEFMNEPTKTPRSDAFIIMWGNTPEGWHGFARQLEAELAEAKKINDMLANQLQGTAYTVKDFMAIAKHHEEIIRQCEGVKEILQIMDCSCAEYVDCKCPRCDALALLNSQPKADN